MRLFEIALSPQPSRFRTYAIALALRRSAVNNLNAPKVPPKTAMRITGHKTMATYLRYHIVTNDDVQAPLEQTDAAISAAGTAAAEPTARPLATEPAQ